MDKNHQKPNIPFGFACDALFGLRMIFTCIGLSDRNKYLKTY